MRGPALTVAILAAQRIVKFGRKCGHFREQTHEPPAGLAPSQPLLANASQQRRIGTKPQRIAAFTSAPSSITLIA